MNTNMHIYTSACNTYGRIFTLVASIITIAISCYSLGASHRQSLVNDYMQLCNSQMRTINDQSIEIEQLSINQKGLNNAK